MARTDYYDDPDAPRPNSIVVAASAAVRDQTDRLLLVQRADSGQWALPGGGMEPGETVAACAVREVREETGIDIEITRLVGIYSDPNHVIAYDDGEVRQQFSVCFAGRLLGGELHRSIESTSVAFVDAAGLERLPIHPTQRLRIGHALERRHAPYLG
ncbi:NUDIX domain-containing protein [Haloactinopolyspora alba]|uniref:NUDIX domain-containing protein n=1 Tax=Haloactinopolyspora alba TaxID=648780 RepID=A0A2P8EBC1_9ACTN|nr:NUDIX domain-containing protein [Haloactinopolyspora alba]PSL06750.1 NUDIX domain-containing protein [Haloactinopolyspora alba]